MIPNVRTLNCALNLACKNKKHKYSVNIFKFYCKLYCKFNHRRTGLEIFGKGGEHEFSQLVPKARERLGASGGMLRRKILKIDSCVLVWVLCIKQVTNEKKILRILVKRNLNRKIVRLFSKNYPTI